MFPVGNIPLTFASPSLSSLPDPLLIELGRCNEHIPPHLLKAGHLNDFSRKRWQCGKLSKGPNKTQYTYTFEGHNATPSPMFAKRVGDKFYISQYRSFAVSCQEFLRRPSDDPDAAGWFEDEEPPSHYFAVLEKVQEGEVSTHTSEQRGGAVCECVVCRLRDLCEKLRESSSSGAESFREVRACEEPHTHTWPRT